MRWLFANIAPYSEELRWWNQQSQRQKGIAPHKWGKIPTLTLFRRQLLTVSRFVCCQ